MAATPGNALNITAAGIVGFDGTATFVGSITTQYNVLVGSATSSTLTNVAPSATVGIPLVSQGAASNPSFTTAVVAGGGTGATSFTAYAPVCGGTSSTNPLQSADTGFSTAGYILTSNGNAALPSWQAATFAGMTWTDEATNFSPAVNNGYFVTGTATATMPAGPSQGDIIEFFVDTTNILTITANSGQIIRLGATVTAAAGTCASNKRGDSIRLVYRASDTCWCALSSVGTWTLT
jgi:hypothetical protein